MCCGALAWACFQPPSPSSPLAVLRFSPWLCVHRRSDVSPCMSAFCQRESHVPQTLRKTGSPSVRGQPSDSSGDDCPAVRPHPLQWVTVQGSSLPCLPFSSLPGGAEQAWTLSYHLWRWHGQTWLGPSFYLSSLAFFGVGRLRNVECRNVGKGGGETGASSPALLVLLTPVPRRLQAPLCSPVPLPSRSQYPIVSLWLTGPGPGGLATPQALATVVASSCLKQLLWPPPKVAVDQQQMIPKGLFIAGWPWGLEQGLRPGEAQRLLVRDQRNGDG